MNTSEIIELAKDQNNWSKLRLYSENSTNFTYPQLKGLFHKRASDKHSGLNHCFKLVGKTGYINSPLFGLWMANLLGGTQL